MTLYTKPSLFRLSELRSVALTSLHMFSVLYRPAPNYEGHVPLLTIERAALALGSAVVSLVNPRRGGN